MASTPGHETQWWKGNVLTTAPLLFPWIVSLTSNSNDRNTKNKPTAEGLGCSASHLSNLLVVSAMHA